MSFSTKGLKYVTAPNGISSLDIICGANSAMTEYDKNKGKEVLQDVSRILRPSRSSKKDLLTKEQQVLRELQQNEEILPADKEMPQKLRQ